MSKLKDYKAALELIRVATSLEQAKEVAEKALFEADSDEERRKMISEIGKFLIENGLIFETAEAIAAAADKAGFKTPRGKVWTKASIARYMPDIRHFVQDVLSKTTAAAAAAVAATLTPPTQPGAVATAAPAPAAVEAAPLVDADGIRVAGAGRVNKPVVETVDEEVGFEDLDDDDLSDLEDLVA